MLINILNHLLLNQYLGNIINVMSMKTRIYFTEGIRKGIAKIDDLTGIFL